MKAAIIPFSFWLSFLATTPVPVVFATPPLPSGLFSDKKHSGHSPLHANRSILTDLHTTVSPLHPGIFQSHYACTRWCRWTGETDEGIGLIKKLNDTSTQVEVGIDAPRMPLDSRRQWYWNRSKLEWEKRGSQKGYGRHCEVVISAHGIANPQWTPLRNKAPSWMELGFNLFSALKDIVKVHVVFPTASYALLQGIKDVRVTTDFSTCKPGPKDMLDAWVAAVTVREFAEGRGCAVGGEDGMGAIILPRPLPESVIKEVLAWPQLEFKA